MLIYLYEDIFIFLDGSLDDRTRFSETWFKDKLSKVDDIDKYLHQAFKAKATFIRYGKEVYL